MLHIKLILKEVAPLIKMITLKIQNVKNTNDMMYLNWIKKI